MQQLPPGGIGPPTPAVTHRLFFALWPDADTRERLADTARKVREDHGSRGRWTRADRYHLTLQFLGDFSECPQALVTRASQAASRVVSEAFVLTLDRVGSFRNRSIPWWLGSAVPAPGVLALWERLGTSLARAGVRTVDSRRLVPHLTILRDAGRPLPETPVSPVRWRVDGFALIHSRVGGGSGYEVAGTWPLTG